MTEDASMVDGKVGADLGDQDGVDEGGVEGVAAPHVAANWAGRAGRGPGGRIVIQYGRITSASMPR
ncbi:hypothetical protein ABTX85_36015 [Streptomyces sp. NPDC096097]|uniref:hypothetical protein n=1 Tax=Streptomyces sp. NPDC096097 TaxID=3155546 RepID=UPI00331ACA00